MTKVTKKQLLEKIEKVEGMLAEHMNLPLFEELKGKIFSQDIRYSGGNEEYCFEIIIPFRPSKLPGHISCVYIYIPLTKNETVENFDKLKLVENLQRSYFLIMIINI